MKLMNKAKLTLEQAKALEERISAIGKANVVKYYLDGTYIKSPYAAINTISNEDLFKAMANGWETLFPMPPNFAMVNGVRVTLNIGLDSALKGVSRPIFAIIKTSLKEVSIGLETYQAKELIYQLTEYVNFLEKNMFSSPKRENG
jgi:hypothetical protein